MRAASSVAYATRESIFTQLGSDGLVGYSIQVDLIASLRQSLEDEGWGGVAREIFVQYSVTWYRAVCHWRIHVTGTSTVIGPLSVLVGLTDDWKDVIVQPCCTAKGRS